MSLEKWVEYGWPYGRAKRVISSIVGNSKVMAVRDHRCEITGVKFRAGLLKH